MKLRLPFVCLVCVLLCGCSAVKSPEQLAESVRESYAACSVITAQAEIQTDSGEEHMSYEVNVTYTNAEHPTAEIELTAPESIAGITAVYDAGRNTLRYDDVILQTTLPERGGLTPADAIPAAISCLISEQPSCVWVEGDLLVLQYQQQTEECSAVRELYLSRQDGRIREARIFCNETQIISCDFHGMTIQ